MIEADPCNRPNSKPGEAGNQRLPESGHSTDFLAQYEQIETDSQGFDLGISLNERVSSNPQSKLLGQPGLASSDSAAVSGSMAAERLVSDPDAAGKLAVLVAEHTEASGETSAKAAVITASAPVQTVAQIPLSTSQHVAHAQVSGDINVSAQAPLVPAKPVQSGAEQYAPGIDGLLGVAKEQGAGALLDIPGSSLQVLPVYGQNVPVTPTANQINAPQAIITAAPEGIVDLISQAVSATNERKDRIIVQLDPPELGRVSIDFKFDAQGLQHITITGETPEALRRLRLMHFDLIQTLEREGFTGQGMTFRQHGTDRNNHGDGAASRTMSGPSNDESPTTQPLTPPQIISPLSVHGSGLNIKL